MEHQEEEDSKTQYFSTTEYSGGDMYGYNSATPQPPKEPSKRPGIVTFICILGFLSGAVGLILGLTGLVADVAEWYRPYLITGAVLTTSGYVGLWKMKKWGLYIVTIMFIVGLTVAYNTNNYSPVNLVGSGIVLTILFFNSGKMD